MSDNKEKKFKKILQMTCKYFDKELEPEIIEIYFDSFKDYNIQNIQKAFSQAIKTLRFFPRVVDIIEIIEGGGDPKDKGFIQATLVLNAIRNVGAYKTVVFNDEITMAVIDRVYGGWIKLCEMREEEEKWFIKDFPKYHKSFVQNRIKGPRFLVGVIEHQNELKGYDESNYLVSVEERLGMFGKSNDECMVRKEIKKEL